MLVMLWDWTQVGRRTEAKSGEVFSRSDVGRRLRLEEGRRRRLEKEPEGKYFPGRTAETDEKERKNFLLEPPSLIVRDYYVSGLRPGHISSSLKEKGLHKSALIAP